MNIYRVRFSISEIFYVKADTFAEAVEAALKIGGRFGQEPTVVKYLGSVRNG